ncbi:CD3324 family protein [Eubacterium sp. 1001713B170207_170306_E7]|uniref:CD3324 family protein n=1 Tax=Eubacterium sp. 1001713B170207_170306_E7 TaxID=2787097 RepID=UPI00189A1B5A|nr:CD3324 family protein [Eubacterium sp. 1001713B170207_170306_E7]
MSYKKAIHILPRELLEKVQEYIDGEFIYIPRIADNKKCWGASTSTRQELKERNARIYADYLAGVSMEALTEKYFLSLKSIQRIIGQLKKEKNH